MQTFHVLIPAADEAEQQRRDDCASFEHLPLTFNPWLARTFCGCGHVQYEGNLAPMHPVRCYKHGCDDECPKARAEQRAMLAPVPGAPDHPVKYRRLSR